MPSSVDRLVFGTAALGLAYGLARAGEAVVALDDANAEALVHAALDAGVRTFDTAPAYGNAEERLGQTLGSEGSVWTKVGRSEAISNDITGAIEESVERSLARLRRPKLELVQWHNWTSGLVNNEHFLACWKSLSRNPKIGALGATTYGREDALMAVESGLFRVVQVEWNLLNQGVVDYVAKAARGRGVQLAVRTVLLQGALTTEGRELPKLEKLVKGVESVRSLAAEMQTSVTRLALRAALDHPEITWVLLGMDRSEQVSEAWAIAAGVGLDPLFHSKIRGLGLRDSRETDPRFWPRT